MTSLPATPPASQGKVLVVDDSSFSRRSLRRMLEEMGFEVEEAADGTQALERFFVSQPRLAFLDLVMPGMYGTQVLAKLIEMNAAAPVIIVTSDIQQATIDEVRQSGARGLLNKPVARPALEAAVAKVLAGGTLWS